MEFYGGPFIRFFAHNYKNKKFLLKITPFVHGSSLSFKFSLNYLGHFHKAKVEAIINKISKNFTLCKIETTSFESIVNDYKKAVELASSVFGVYFHMKRETMARLLEPKDYERKYCLKILDGAAGKADNEDSYS